MNADPHVNITLDVIVVCGFAGCTWSMQIDPDGGADALAVQQAYMDHLDEHDPDEDPECETTDRWLNTAHALVDECPSCHTHHAQPHTEYCKLAQLAAHDAEVARALAEDRIPGRGGLYAGQLYAGDTPEQIAAEQARVDRFMAGGEDR